MKEKHFAYKITHSSSGIVCTHSIIEEDKMLDLLEEIQDQYSEGLFWIFKQIGNQPEEQLCIIDCANKRIFYSYSGEVEKISETIAKLHH